jgi:hypothetical protein
VQANKSQGPRSVPPHYPRKYQYFGTNLRDFGPVPAFYANFLGESGRILIDFTAMT